MYDSEHFEILEMIARHTHTNTHKAKECNVDLKCVDWTRVSLIKNIETNQARGVSERKATMYSAELEK